MDKFVIRKGGKNLIMHHGDEYIPWHKVEAVIFLGNKRNIAWSSVGQELDPMACKHFKTKGGMNLLAYK